MRGRGKDGVKQRGIVRGWGYFPSYSLGSMMAAQLFQQAKKERPNVDEEIRKGEFTALKEWLNEKVHRQGSKYESLDDLLVAITGNPLDPSIFVNYLREKYTPK